MFCRVCVLNANVSITLKQKFSSKMNSEMMLAATDQSLLPIVRDQLSC